MRRMFGTMLAVALLGSATVPANAELLSYKYSGTVTKATNFEPSIPELPPATTHPGETFRGNFSFDTNDVSYDEGEGYYFVPLTSVNFALPEEDFYEDFSGPGGQVFSNPALGTTEVQAGRADYQYRLNLLFNTGSGPFDPKSLYGKNASMQFTDYGPNGFQVEGVAMVAPVPEPATWLAMMLGVIMAGLAAHARSSRTAPARPRLEPAFA